MRVLLIVLAYWALAYALRPPRALALLFAPLAWGLLAAAWALVAFGGGPDLPQVGPVMAALAFALVAPAALVVAARVLAARPRAASLVAFANGLAWIAAWLTVRVSP